MKISKSQIAILHFEALESVSWSIMLLYIWKRRVRARQCLFVTPLPSVAIYQRLALFVWGLLTVGTFQPEKHTIFVFILNRSLNSAQMYNNLGTKRFYVYTCSRIYMSFSQWWLYSLYEKTDGDLRFASHTRHFLTVMNRFQYMTHLGYQKRNYFECFVSHRTQIRLKVHI